MRINFQQYFFYVIFSFVFLFSACKSQQLAFSDRSSGTTTSNDSAVKPNEMPTPPTKTVAPQAPKLVYDSTKVSFKVKQKTETETTIKQEDDDEEPTITSSTKIDRIEKYRKREKEKGNWLSGGFLASGMALLVVALVLALVGSGPAGLLALIGGVLFLAGFIFTMVALLSR